ncbi:uncharacterized, partial [Tachysurus ichikawai]
SSSPLLETAVLRWEPRAIQKPVRLEGRGHTAKPHWMSSRRAWLVSVVHPMVGNTARVAMVTALGLTA